MNPVRRILRIALPYRRYWTGAVLLGFLTIGSAMGLMMTSGYIIAAAALHPNIAELQVAIVGVRFFGISRGIFRYLERLVSHHATFHLLARLRVWFYRALEPLAPARLQEQRSGDMVSRIVSDLKTLENLFLRIVSPTLVAVLVGLLLAGLLGPLHLPALGWAVCVYLVSGTVIPWITHRRTASLDREIGPLNANLSSLIVDHLQGLDDLLILDAAGNHAQQLLDVQHRLTYLQRRKARIDGVQDALMTGSSFVAAGLALMSAIPAVAAGALDGVYLTVIVLGILAAFEAVQPLPSAWSQFSAGHDAARRLFDIVDAKPDISDPEGNPPVPSQPNLSIDRLTFGYDTEAAPVLRDVSIKIPFGNRVAIAGPSGAGKSTMMNCLLRFWDVPAKTVFINHNDIRTFRADSVRQQFAVMAQQTHLFNGTLRENLLLANPDAQGAEITTALEQSELGDWFSSLPKGLDTWIGEQGLTLSGGERQRLALARMLLQPASIWILDEPTANLDVQTEARLVETIHKLTAKRTLIMITHRLIEMERYNQICVLQNGEIIERGTHGKLMASEGLYQQMMRVQNMERWETT